MFTELEFKYPHNVLFAILALAAVVFFIASFRKKGKIIALLRLDYKLRFRALRSVLLILGLGLLVFSLMGPQVFTGYTEVEKKGVDIYILMDTSKSMLVSDIKPDRLSVAKRIVENLIDNLTGDRIGFIPFASDAYIQMPLTDDYQLARMFLNVMDTDMISGGGTNLEAAIRLANNSFDRTSAAAKVIIIISDGEENDGSGENVLRNIKDDSLKIYTIGVGTERGGLIPVYDRTGFSVVDYMKDERGNPVTSRLNTGVLRKIADEGNGVFYQTGLQGMEIAPLLNELSHLERDVRAVEQIKRYRQLYQYFLAVGILLFLIAWLLPEKGFKP